MKYLILYCIISTILLLLLFLNYRKLQIHDYNSEITQVMIIENLKLADENKLAKSAFLKREDTGIVVYEKGNYIVLYYHLTVDEPTSEVIYIFNPSTNLYEEVKNVTNDIYQHFTVISYKENLYSK